MSDNKTLDQYIVLKTLGSGGTSKVKLGYDTDNKRKVAIKMLKDNLSEKTLKLVFQEVQIMKELKHPNVLDQIEFK